jgi:hypothetical protein
MPIATKKAAPKKVATKTTAKTSAPKKAKSNTDSQKVLVLAANNQSFWTKDGQILNSLQALHDAFASMESVVYAYHATKDAHHFADWVEIVLLDSACAADLRKAKTPGSAKTVVAKHLKTYQS